MLERLKQKFMSCRTILFYELLCGLSMNSFGMGDELKEDFECVDVDRNGSLEFSEMKPFLLCIKVLMTSDVS